MNFLGAVHNLSDMTTNRLKSLKVDQFIVSATRSIGLLTEIY